MKIPTYIINLESRTDRRAHVQKEFSKHKEFDTSIADAKIHTFAAVGLMAHDTTHHSRFD